MTQENRDNWEEEFDENFFRPLAREKIIENLSNPNVYLDLTDIKHFIRNLLSQTRLQERERIAEFAEREISICACHSKSDKYECCVRVEMLGELLSLIKEPKV